MTMYNSDEDVNFDSGFSDWERFLDDEVSCPEYSFSPQTDDTSSLNFNRDLNSKQGILNNDGSQYMVTSSGNSYKAECADFQSLEALSCQSFSKMAQANSGHYFHGNTQEDFDRNEITDLNRSSACQLLNTANQGIYEGESMRIPSPEILKNQTASSHGSESYRMMASSQQGFRDEIMASQDYDSQLMVTSIQESQGSQNMVTSSQESLGSHKMVVSSQESLGSQKMMVSSQESLGSQKMIFSSQENADNHKMVTSSQEMVSEVNNPHELNSKVIEAEGALMKLHNLIQLRNSDQSKLIQNFENDGNEYLRSKKFCNRCHKLNKSRILSIRKKELIISKREDALREREEQLAAREADILKREDILKRKYYEEYFFASSKKLKTT